MSLGVARSVLGWVLLAAFFGMVGLWVTFGFAPTLAEQVPDLFGAFGDPSAFWPILAGALAGVGAAWALAPGVGGDDKGGGEGGAHLSPLAVAILGPAALIMMLSAYWPCETEGSQFWGSLRRALEAFEGYVAEPFGEEVHGCPQEFPQTLTAGVILAKFTIVLVIGIGLAYVLRHSIDALRARFARQVVHSDAADDPGARLT